MKQKDGEEDVDDDEADSFEEEEEKVGIRVDYLEKL